jgi:basic membrane protein A
VAAFSDPAKGKEIAKAMIDEGVDVIYTAAGSTGTGAFQAVKEAQDAKKEVWAIGVDSDQGKPNVKNNVPEEVKPYIISSMLKRVDVAVYDTIKAVNEGTFKGGLQVFNLKNGGIDYSTTGGKIDDIKAKIDDFKKQIIDGKITVPTKP